MTVSMSDIWDRTVQVLRGRLSMLAWIAALLVFAPEVVQAAAQMFLVGSVTSLAAVAGAALMFFVVVMVAFVLRIWGNASIVAAGSDPLYDRSSAVAHGARRLPAVIGITLLLGLAALVLVLPIFVLIGSSINWVALSQGIPPDPTSLPPFGAIMGAFLYMVVLLFVLLFVVIRLTLLMPVIVNERLGAGAIARAWQLTRGLFWRLFGVLFLFGLVFLIATSAVTMILTLIARLVLGSGHEAAATFVGQVGGGAVAAAYLIVTGVFTAQLYRALTGREAAETFA